MEPQNPIGSRVTQLPAYPGQRVLELRGVKLVDKKLVRRTAYFLVSDVKELLRDLIKRFEVQDDEVENPFMGPIKSNDTEFIINRIPDTPIQSESQRLRDEQELDYRVDIFLSDLTRSALNDRKSIYYMAAFLLVNKAFGVNIPIFYNDRLIDITTQSSSDGSSRINSISPLGTDTLPDDIFKNEIFTRLDSLDVLTKFKMASKTLQYQKYKYEHLIPTLPYQSTMNIYREYLAEKDPQRKEYLYKLYYYARSITPYFNESAMDGDDNNLDIIAINLAYQLNSMIVDIKQQFFRNNYMFAIVNDIYGSGRTDIIQMMIDAGLLTMDEFVDIVEPSYSKHEYLTFIPSNYITFMNYPPLRQKLEMYQREEDPRIKYLIESIEDGSFDNTFDNYLLLDAVKKGYVKVLIKFLPFEYKQRSFMKDVPVGSEDAKLLWSKMERNPISDFDLLGIKPTYDQLATYIRNSAIDVSVESTIKMLLVSGLEISDIDLHSDILVEDNIQIYKVGSDEVRVVRDLGDNRYIALINTDYNSTNFLTILHKFGTHYIMYPISSERQLHMAKFFASLTDNEMKSLVGVVDISYVYYLYNDSVPMQSYKKIIENVAKVDIKAAANRGHVYNIPSSVSYAWLLNQN